ncbi:MAG: ACP S-malonyltransferase [Planctomycetales bacterium]|nr:ACP S-malonyltransferase [Planctomycetales bacterium]
MSKIAFLFPGQGAQAVGMGRSLYDQLPAARALFDQANAVLGYDLTTICFEDPDGVLDSTVYSQPALFVSSLAALEKLKADAPEVVAQCAATAGLSLGEYTSMVLAGVMDFETALGVVRERGQAMQDAADATPSGMVSILGMELAAVEALCDRCRQPGEVLQVANHLCPGNIVVSGHNDSCERVAAEAMEAGAMKAVPLAVAGAFHTPIMQPAVERLKEALEAAELSAPKLPVISNVDAKSHDSPEEIRELLIRQVVSPVQWESSMRQLLDNGFDSFYEIGAGKVLRGLMRRIDRKASVENVFA